MGLFFLTAMISSLLTGVGRDAQYIAEVIAARENAAQAKGKKKRTPDMERQVIETG